MAITMAQRVALKVAIVESGLKQFVVADEAHIDETRFSKILNGRIDPTDDEKKGLARVLRRPVNVLFPSVAA